MDTFLFRFNRYFFLFSHKLHLRSRIMIRAVLLLVFMQAATLYTYAQWELIHPSSALHKTFIKSQQLKGTNSFCAIGSELAFTQDTGKTWQPAPEFNPPVLLTPTYEYQDVFFCSPSLAYLVHDNKLFKTNDAGVNWIEQLSLSPSNKNPLYAASSHFTSISFLDNDHGFAVGTFQKNI